MGREGLIKEMEYSPWRGEPKFPLIKQQTTTWAGLCLITLGNKIKKEDAVWNISPDSTLLGVTDA